MKIKTYIIVTILSLLALGAALVFSNVSNAQLSGGGTIGQLEQWRSLGGYLVPRDATLGLKVPGLATSTTGCLSVASDGIITANGSACGSGSGSNGSSLHASTSANTFIYPRYGLYHSAPYYVATSTTNSYLAGDGTVGAPAYSFSNDPDTGIFHSDTNAVSLSGGGSGAQWNGSSFTPNSIASVRSIGADLTPWQNVYIGRLTSANWLLSTSSLTTNTLFITNTGYPSVIIGADTASPNGNLTINSQSQGPYTGVGLINDSVKGSLVIDNTNSIGGISPNIVVQNSTGGGSCLMIPLSSQNGTACLRTYNSLSSIFNIIAPYNASGNESNLSTTIVNSDGGTNTLDVGLEDYGGTYPTGRQMYMHALSSSFATPFPTMSFGWWQQAMGNTSNSTSSWGWLVASTTVKGSVGTTTVVGIGDMWTGGYSKGGGSAGIDYGVRGVEDGTGATVQLVSSSTRSKALEVFSRSGDTFTSLFTANNNGNIGIGTSTPAAPLSVSVEGNAASFIQVETPGNQANQQATLNLMTKSNGLYLGATGNTGWSFSARGNAFNNTAQQNGLDLSYWNGSTYVDPLYVTPTGNIGVGTTSPQATLSVQSTSGAGSNPVFSVASSTGADLFSILGNRQINIRGNKGIIADPTNFNWFFGDCGNLTATGQFNTCVGRNALLVNAGGASNMAIGLGALGNNTSGSRNVGIGVNSLAFTQSGVDNVAIGDSAGLGVSSNSNNRNTFIGAQAGRLTTTGSNNLFLGYQAASTTSSGSFNIAIGFGTKLPSITGSNQLNIGNLIYGTGIDGTSDTLSTGNIGIGTSSPNAKFSITGTAAGKMVQWITSAGTNMLDIVNDTATVVLKGIWDFSGATVKQHTYNSFSYATSTAWAGTTTIALGPASVAETWNNVKCFTDAGTLYAAFDDGTNVTNYFQASTTVGTVTLSTNNAFTSSEKRYVKIGTPATSPTSISCTVDKTVN